LVDGDGEKATKSPAKVQSWITEGRELVFKPGFFNTNSEYRLTAVMRLLTDRKIWASQVA
jgi:hypothetical protein